jgi:hypothetical protein
MQWDGHIPFYTIGVSGTQKAMETAEWGTFGKTGNDPLTYVRLIDCSTEHLQAILRSQKQIWGTDYEYLIRAILRDRDAVEPGDLAADARHQRLLAMWAVVAFIYGLTTLTIAAVVAYIQNPILHPRFLVVTAIVSIHAILWGGWKLKQVWE